jgi:hypothetical protein
MSDLPSALAPVLPMLVVASAGQSFETSSAITVLAGVTFLAVAVNQLLQMRERLSDRKTPSVNVKPDPHSEYRTRKDCIEICEKDRAWIRRVEVSVPAVERQARQELKEGTDNLHQRVDTMHTSMNAQFNDIAGKLGRIAGRLGLPQEDSH